MKVVQLFEQKEQLDLTIVYQCIQGLNGLKNIPFDVKQVDVQYRPHGHAAKKECFNNAFRYILDNLDAVYVLGFIFMYNIPIEHAWVKDQSTYFDVTLIPQNQQGYVKVAEFTFDQIAEYVNVHSGAPSLWDLNRFFGKSHSHK